MIRPRYTLHELAARLGGRVLGDGEVVVTRMASLAHARAGDLSFLANSKYRAQLVSTAASAVVVDEAAQDLTTLPRIVTDNPYAYFARASALLNPEPLVMPGVHPSAMVDASVNLPASAAVGPHVTIGAGCVIGDNVVIGAGCVIGDNVTVGAGSRLFARVTVYHGCEIGRDCVLNAGVVIGADGFGYAEQDGVWVKIPQVGRVVLGNAVEIGANTTIDRGALDDTVIGDGVKLDNLIQIGHNVRIGAHTVIAGCAGVAGSARIGSHCRIGGAAMILGHLDIADGVTVSPGSMITRSLTQVDTYTALMPFQPHAKWLRTAAQLRHLEDVMTRIAQLENELKSLKKEQ